MSTAGLRVPGYVVDRLIGRGAAGDVWAARVTGSIDQVALKLVRGVSRDQLDAAHHEAALLGALDHPHLVRLHDVLAVRDGVVLVLDLADAGSLASLIRARGRLTPGEVVTVLAPIATALAYVHGRSVVHGDVAPANILFTAAGHPMLADLGVARLLGDDRDVSSTPAYLDPEVARGGLPAPASDVFMLGAAGYHALTGMTVWPDTSAAAAVAAAVHADLPDVRIELARVGVPAGVVAVIARALALEPAARGTATDFALDLGQAATPAPVELTAGRPRTEPALTASPGPRVAPAPDRRGGGRHAAPPRHAAGRRSTAARAEPDPAVHTAVAQAGSGAPFTQIIGSRPRPAAPPRRRLSRRWLVAGAAGVLVLTGVGVAWAVVGTSGGSPHPGTSASGPQVPGALSGASASTGDSTADGTTITGPLDAASAADVLASLDVLRQRAFATRSLLLLTGVYVTGPLLDDDRALLQRLVPDGCGLQGVRTVYSSVQVLGQDATSVQLLARAQLSPSVLVCNGKVSGQAAGTAGSVVHITLARVGSGYLISSLTNG